MEVIRDINGKVIQRSRNFAGIRRYVGGMNSPIIVKIDISEVGHGDGKLCMLFENGSSFETNYPPGLDALKRLLRNWRNVYGAPFSINGQDAGIVNPSNPAL